MFSTEKYAWSSLLKVGIPGFDSLTESRKKTFTVGIHNNGVGSEDKGGAVPPSRIFIDSTDKVERGLMVLFFGLVFTVGPLLHWKFFCRSPWFTASLLDVQQKIVVWGRLGMFACCVIGKGNNGFASIPLRG